MLSYHERLNIAQLSLNKQQEAYSIAQNKYSAGLIREVEALQMEVDLSEAANNYDIERVDYSSQIDLFKERLGIDLRDSVVVKSDPGYNLVLVDVEKAVSLAMENRLELKENEIQIELAQMEIKKRKAEGMINGDIDSQSMALERERLNNAYISRLESFINYKLLLSDLMRKTFFDFEKNISMLGK